MEAAGIRATDEVLELLRARSRPVDILVGPGNNGGDGLVVARHLTVSGADVRVLTPFGARRLRGGAGDTAVNYGICERSGIPMEDRSWKELLHAPNLGLRADALVVDAILGTGATRPLEGDFLAWVKGLPGLAPEVVSLDIPSGLDCDTGLVLGAALRAGTTITFVATKVGFFLNDGPAHVGRIVVADIGIGEGMLRY
jgi:NAD(P)H-hydrate epimerase